MSIADSDNNTGKSELPKVLFTTPILQHPPVGGPELRIENSIKALSRVCELYLISRKGKSQRGGKETESFYKSICRSFFYLEDIRSKQNLLLKMASYRIYVPYRFLWLMLNFPLRVFSKIVRKIFTKSDIGDSDLLIDFYDDNNIDVMWFGYGNISYNLIKEIRMKRTDIKMVCDTDSVWSRFILRELPYIDNEKRRNEVKREGAHKQREERELVNLCDVVTAVSEVDSEYYRNLSITKEKIKLFSNVIDVVSYMKDVAAPEKYKKPCIYLAGTFGHYNSPMDTAARWVVEEILPRVQKQIPEVHFYILGKGSKYSLKYIKNPSITILGQVPSVLPYLCNADVSIVPLKFESGTRFKILEAGACGIPIVSTTLGAEGLPVKNNRDILLADEPEDFAQAIVKLIRDKKFALNLAGHCRELIMREFSLDTLSEEAKQIFSYLRLS